MTPVDRVEALARALRADPAPPIDGLSAAGARAAVHAAVATWTRDALDAVARLPGQPFRHAAVIAPRTVATAPLEWLVGWWLADTAPRWKHPASQPRFAPWVSAHATRVGLPLEVTPARDALADAEVVVVMGGDDTVAAVRRDHGAHAVVLGFGHKASVGWWTAPDAASADALAHDLLLHDGRGCMTPAVLLTPDPDAAARHLHAALTSRAAAWPAGPLTDADAARRRARADLGRMIGHVRRAGDVALVSLPLSHARLAALPRLVTIAGCDDRTAALAWLAPQASVVSTLVTDDRGWPHDALPVTRVCAPGLAQRPPLLRAHDGVPTPAAWRRPG